MTEEILTPAAKWKARQQRDRERSQAYRDVAKTVGRPLPSAVDRAIATAVGEVWRTKIAGIVGLDRDAQSAASAEPISLHRVAERAVAILVAKQGRKQGVTVDPKVIGRAVMQRLRPRLSDRYFRSKAKGIEVEIHQM
ncbi:hypothetical protein [Hansschlegelia sp. KR7-227]|uniref:hypothetical protein n=1 Tax=Hansschlegelia sp. KR7-227 TaxID=3400914 RepID=UPI003C04A855